MKTERDAMNKTDRQIITLFIENIDTTGMDEYVAGATLQQHMAEACGEYILGQAGWQDSYFASCDAVAGWQIADKPGDATDAECHILAEDAARLYAEYASALGL